MNSLSLKNIALNITDGEHGTVKDDIEGEYFYLSNKNIIDNNVIYDKNDRKISKDTFEKINKRIKLEKDDLLLSTVGTIGKTVIVKEQPNYTFQRSVGIIKINKKLADPYYIKYYLDTPIIQKKLNQIANGGVQKGLYISDLENLKIDIPSIQIQKKIANSLKILDDKIDINNKIINESEKLAKKIYDYWFIQFEFPDKNGNPYKSSNGKMIYNEKLKKEIPENWKVGNLYDIADFINGLACQKYRPKKNELGLPVIKIREMNEGISSDTERVSSGINEKYIVNDNSILFSWSATLEVIRWYGGKAGLNQHIFKINPTKYGMNYTYQQLKSYINNFVKIALSRKTTMGHITTDHIKQSVIVLPPKSIVNRYEKMVSSLYDKLLLKSKENEELSKLKNFLLPLLMNGQVGFKD